MARPRTKHKVAVDIDFTLRRQFGKKSFRPTQREIITAALEGHDVFVQAATSFGKSLCFQLPAVIDHGITIVVSPLLSLMMNQVASLRAAKIDARTLNSQISPRERDEIYRDLQTGHPLTRLLYVTPELCSTNSFRTKIRRVHGQGELARVVIDEAHCISEWGHDFRPDFKLLSWFRTELPDVPIMCLTATANQHVRTDVLATMGINRSPDRLRQFTMTAYRPNLVLQVRFTQDWDDDARLLDFVKWYKEVLERRREDWRQRQLESEGQRLDSVPGIIYTFSRDECESIASQLREHGIAARHFHARLSPDEKKTVLDGWVHNVPGYDVIVATTAFGMGIDKENVRFVVHWRIPKTFEGYYQEVGRAGRDGKISLCFLYYAREDMERMMMLAQQTKIQKRKRGQDPAPDSEESRNARIRSLEKLTQYCESTSQCRHACITAYFGEEVVPDCTSGCDWHLDPDDLKRRHAEGLASYSFIMTQRELGEFQPLDESAYEQYAWDYYTSLPSPPSAPAW